MILVMGSLNTVALLIGIVFRYLTELKMMKYKGKLSYTDDLYTTSNWKPLVFELFVFFWHPMPFLWDVTFDEWDDNLKRHIKHSANDIILAFMIMT